ncbi:glycoside hydrolase family 43 protein [Saccharibacillus sp. CPCC 101409]|uniref:glycoside hydrolase family 43 protein n=1 Tax=Saccharibacillus sp. CPCC 101409 TaxID=3058041 RepID=UPI0026715D76|nr:glycoside hydrolase family 43 protein [Saccharibacillus sp. CPCC 101409]MDO3409799.1 glycoside hydrolase family 43 protein [Saccharibacillus sp. CPCC 101409]
MPAYNAASDANRPQRGHRLADIPLHDPFVLADKRTRTYYLYSGAAPRLNGVDRHGVLVYKSADLDEWEGPYVVFAVPDGVWADPQHGAWAPEVHEHGGRFYLFVTLHNEGRPLEGGPVNGYGRHWRGTAVAVSDSPEGPFELLDADAPVVPFADMTLDGTLHIDEDGLPWMAYCHEWVQTIDGTVEAVRLTDDLSAAASEPIVLFRGSDAPWLEEGEAPLPPEGKVREYVTDGCQLHRTSGGSLVMLWSSYEDGGYVQTIARSASGRLEGPWEQLEPLVKEDSGHGMLFRTFDGQWKLILHRPFKLPESRGYLYDIEDTGETFRLKR